MKDELSPPARLGRRDRTTWSPWRSVFAFGLVSLAADMVYEGMRSMSGPLLGALGASGLVVGIVTGAGEAVALILRLFTGAWADQRRLHWRLTVIGYALTAVCVPLLAVTPFLGAAGLATAAALILLERTGKAIRSPAKSALLARLATDTGRGRGFGVHKALDQIGAFSGPLLLSGIAAATGLLWPGFAVLAIPGALSLLLLARLRRRAPIAVADPPDDDAAGDGSSPRPARWGASAFGAGLPAAFHLFSVAAALMTAGLMTFGIISFHLVQDDVIAVAAVPLVYAAAMAVQAVAALATGFAFDRIGGRVLLVVPALVAVVPALAFDDRLAIVVAGIAAWAVATGVLDSTVKAFVADLVPDGRRATAYGVFAAVQGMGAIAGGALAGALAENHAAALAAIVAIVQVAAAAILLGTTQHTRTRT
ncbi:MFS transporter [Nocardioides sp. GCM10030258]